MEKYSISFIAWVLLLGLMIGAVTGSLLHQIFGIEVLNRPLLEPSLTVAKDFYVLKRLELQFTPASLIGLIITVILIYRKNKG